MTVILDQQDIDVVHRFGRRRSGHHAVAPNRKGKRLFDKALPNDEARLLEILSGLSGHGRTCSSWINDDGTMVWLKPQHLGHGTLHLRTDPIILQRTQ